MEKVLEKINALSVLAGTGKIDGERMARLTGWSETYLKRVAIERQRNRNFLILLELVARKGLLLEYEKKLEGMKFV